VFTTHTPVPAGIDVFPPDLVERYFAPCCAQLGLSRDQFMAFGRQNPADPNEPLSMAVLAIRLSGATNGVSALHARVSQRMWSGLWPDVPVDDIPITSITNGVHVRGWLSQDMAGLFDAYLGPRWVSHPADQSVWSGWSRSPTRNSGARMSGGASVWRALPGGDCARSWSSVAHRRRSGTGEEVLTPRP